MNSILVIEDDHAFRLVIAEFLRTRGFQVVEADGGSQGVELARREHPDLVLSDINEKAHPFC